MAIHFSIPAWKIPWTEEPGSYSPQGHKESDMTEQVNNKNMVQIQHSLVYRYSFIGTEHGKMLS